MNSSETRARIEHFFSQWGESKEALRQSFYDMFTPDCTFVNPGFPVCVGPEDTDVKMIGPCADLIQQDTIRVEVRTMLVDGSTAVHERIDHIIRADGSTAISIEVTGVMELTADGRIQEWREYFDTAPVMAFVDQVSVANGAGAADSQPTRNQEL